MQEVKALLEKAEDTDCRASLLRFMTEFSRHMSPRGLDTDVRHILVLVMLVGRLNDPKPMLRCAAAQLLISEAPAHTPLIVNADGLTVLKPAQWYPWLGGLPLKQISWHHANEAVPPCCESQPPSKLDLGAGLCKLF